MNRILAKILPALMTITLFAVSGLGQTDWTGEYLYDEDGGETAGGTKIYVAHILRVYEAEGRLAAHIYSQGFQTSRDIFADVRVMDSKLMLYFREKGPDQVFGDFEKGSLLLTLERESDGLLTKWGSFQPVLESNADNGKERFKRNENPKDKKSREYPR